MVVVKYERIANKSKYFVYKKSRIERDLDREIETAIIQQQLQQLLLQF